MERKQQQTKPQKNDDSSSDNGDIAAVLIEKGIEQKVARHLVNSYDKEKIENNLDWFEWKQKNYPNSIKTNPAAVCLFPETLYN